LRRPHLGARFSAAAAVGDPAAQIISTISSESAGDWIVRVRWAEHTADFHYRGIFAEHLARVAESTLRSVIQPGLPVIPKKRAATA